MCDGINAGARFLVLLVQHRTQHALETKSMEDLRKISGINNSRQPIHSIPSPYDMKSYLRRGLSCLLLAASFLAITNASAVNMGNEIPSISKMDLLNSPPEQYDEGTRSKEVTQTSTSTQCVNGQCQTCYNGVCQPSGGTGYGNGPNGASNIATKEGYNRRWIMLGTAIVQVVVFASVMQV